MTQLATGEQPLIPQNTRLIPLTQGKYAIVDAADYKWLMQWNWHAVHKDHRWYASRKGPRSQVPRQSVMMHRLILGITNPLVQCDHDDGDGLHNWRTNLRIATNSENRRNHRLYRSNSSGFIGVDWSKKDKIYRARIYINGKRVTVAHSSDPVVAAKARDEAALKHYGSFASLNFRSEK